MYKTTSIWPLVPVECLVEWLGAPQSTLLDVRKLVEFARERVAGTDCQLISDVDGGRPNIGARSKVVFCCRFVQ